MSACGLPDCGGAAAPRPVPCPLRSLPRRLPSDPIEASLLAGRASGPVADTMAVTPSAYPAQVEPLSAAEQGIPHNSR